MIPIRKGEIPMQLNNFPVVLYGAGYAGRRCRQLLDNAGIRITFFVDDDKVKQGKEIAGIKVYSYNDLEEYCKKQENVHIILTSIYGAQIYKRLKGIPNITIYEMYDWLAESAIPERTGQNIYSKEELEKFKENVETLKGNLNDEESKKVFSNLFRYMQTGDGTYISDICSTEEQYFIPEVLEYFKGKKFTILDAGAYEGELIRAILDKDLDVREWYCFELSKNNYQILMQNAKENGFRGDQICINKRLWDQPGNLYIQGEGVFSKAVVENKSGEVAEVTTIDEYFKEIHVDLIKMDIEGAEMKALLGGMNVIKRDRPVLAISIYHTIEDFYTIPQLIFKELDNYEYYVRHHSMVFTETVLYAIPKR